VRPALLAVLLPALTLGACGNERSLVTDLVVRPSAQTREHRFPAAGLTFELPDNVEVKEAAPPGVFRATLGEAVVSGFAYRRHEQLPRTDRQLDKALERLERETEQRSDSFRLVMSRTTKVAGAPAVELLGDQTISQGRLRTRSLHVYDGNAEYVIELLAPRDEFERLDRDLFPVIRRTLEATGEVRRPES